MKYILVFLFCLNYAVGVELSSLCSQTTGTSCEIKNPQNEITNNGVFNKNINIAIQTQITNFINYNDINIGTNTINVSGAGNTIQNLINYGRIIANSTSGNNTGASFASWSSGVFQNFYNYGYISGGITLTKNSKDSINITNYGIMAGVDTATGGGPGQESVTVDNYNLINLHPETKMHFADLNELVIKNYAIKIEQNSQNFNNSSYNDTFNNKVNNSHLYASETNSVTFSDENSRLILSAGGDFEFGQDYLTNKLILSRKGNTQNPDENHIDAFRLTTKDNYLELSTTPTHFKLNVNGAMSEVALTHKANIKSINLMTLQSNDIIFEQNYQPVRQRKNRTKKPQRTDNFYLNFTPYAAYNELLKQNRYNLSGFEYGFIAAFSQKVWSESYGVHLGFGYGEYKNKSDDSHFKDFYIKNMNFMGGFHYKRDLLYGVFVKARLDGFYFMNEFGKVPYYYELGAKPNAFGAGGSVYLGQSFNFRQLGVLSLEAGLDYKALGQMKELKIIDEFQSKNESYEANLYHLLYGDLALAYRKQLSYGLRFNAKLGVRANALKNLAKGKLVIYDKSYDFTLDNDEFMGFGNVGLNYKLFEKFDLSLNYSGVLGDKSTSHAGNFAFKLWW